MRVVTPSSLKWLIRRRAQVAGRLISAECALGQIQSLQSQYELQIACIKQLRGDLTALDAVISQHDIPIDPLSIPPCNGQRRPSFYAHGGLTRAIYTCLREARGNWRTTTEIAVFVTAHCNRPILDEENETYRDSVSTMLRKLCREKKILRTREVGAWRTEPRWALAKKNE